MVYSEANIISLGWFYICVENGAYRSAKRARLLQEGAYDDGGFVWGDEDPVVIQMKECSFEELKGGPILQKRVLLLLWLERTGVRLTEAC